LAHKTLSVKSANKSCTWLIGDQQIAKRRGEKFKRIKCSTLAKLLKESLAEESIYSLQNAAAAGAAGAMLGQDEDIRAADSIS